MADDGRDLSDYLIGSGREPEGDLFWRVLDEGALRRGRWKYWAANSTDGDRPVTNEALYDLGADQGEHTNLIRRHPEIARSLRNSYRSIEKTLLRYPLNAKPLSGDPTPYVLPE